jgi:hypothetical protein
MVRAPLSFLVALVLLTAVLGIRFYNEPQLTVGMRVESTLVSPQTTDVIDWEATDKAQAEVRREAVQVFALVPEADERMRRRLDELLLEGGQILRTAGPFPYLNPGILSSEAQRQLRRLPEARWQRLKQLIEQTDVFPTQGAFEQNVLQGLLRRRSVGDLDEVIDRIERARAAYAQAALRSRTAPFVYQDRLLDLTPTQWSAIERQAPLALRRLTAFGIMPGVPQQFREQGIAAQLSPDLDPLSRQLIVDLVASILESNLHVDRLETLRQAEQAAQNVPPVRIHVERGQVLLRQGDVVTPRWFNILDQLHLTQRGVNWQELGVLMLLEVLALRLFLWWKENSARCCNERKQDLALKLFVVLSTAGIGAIISPAWVGWGGFLPLIAVGLLLGHFYGSTRGVAVLLMLALPFWYGLEIPVTIFLALLAGGLVAALLVGRLRAREEMALLGILAALVQGGVFALLSVLLGEIGDWRDLLIQTLQVTGGGVVASIVALGASPYLERLFDVLTPIRLSELANPNRPLLKRLAAEAPGTFQHTLFVANLAEAAAQALGDNAELVRTGTLYHDIGKMVRPRYFIENQMGMPNPHQQLDDPWHSAQIIRDHVTDGLKLARQYGLPKLIQNFIPEHQGTIQIAYFYHQAVQQIGAESVHEEDFRYPGPIPQTRETGLVMLADACEAALRSLKETTENEAVAMVQRIFMARWRDGQLKDSGLREEELPQISRIFVKVWKEQNHQRIRYPAPACPPADAPMASSTVR